MACEKWEKSISNANSMDAIYLRNVLDPEYKRTKIESNLLQ
jgi:hypothetical protein